MKPDNATIEALKLEYKRLILVEDYDGDQYVCRLPTSAEVDRYIQGANKVDTKLDAIRGIALACTVWPDHDTMTKLTDDFPFLAATLETKISEFGKLHQNAIVKKL
ncbi:MAG: hypothetical protein FWD57_06030 [Polyangiaceae bacterium]|nr:hypothetical protein [Polyangiaceae bacterium]